MRIEKPLPVSAHIKLLRRAQSDFRRADWLFDVGQSEAVCQTILRPVFGGVIKCKEAEGC